ncbi:MAG: homoserine dehydrogenase, partial [Anaerolineales bacterium]|nr:homoserine dehydrogenase [Anaerolineales bacterium]
MTHFKLALIGFGNVGQELARLLLRKQQELKDNYDLTFSVTAITTGSHGAAIAPDGIDLHEALAIAEKDGMLDSLSAFPAPADKLDFIRQSGADVLFENSPVNYETGQPAVIHIHTAL